MSQPRRSPPEQKFGPYSGITVAVWLNTVDTEDGPMTFRSVSVTRRYRDKKTGEWKDANSYNPTDLPALIFALQRAQEFIFLNPLINKKYADHKQPNDDHPDNHTTQEDSSDAPY